MVDLFEEWSVGALDPYEMTQDQLEELIGEMAREAQAWVPLCPVWPGLKGIECEPVESYIHNVEEHAMLCGPIKKEWGMRLAELLKLDLEDLKAELRRSEEFKSWEGFQRLTGWLDGEHKPPHFVPEGTDMATIDPMELWIMAAQDNYPELTPSWSENRWEEELRAYMAIHLDDGLRHLRERANRYNQDHAFRCAVGFAASDHPYMAYQSWTFDDDAEGYDQTYKDLKSRQYFDAVKVYSRDELYDLARRMGRQLTGGVDLDMETYRRYLLNRSSWGSRDWNKATYEELAADARDNRKWQEFKKYTNYRIERRQIASDMGVDDVLTDESTIFVTTPRGGLEFLGIFAYANDLRKQQVPSFYEPAEKDRPAHFLTEEYLGRLVGRNWLESRSEPIRRVVLIDDTVESGEQQNKAHETLHRFFGPDVEIVHMAACGRRRPDPFYYNMSFVDRDNGELIDVPDPGDGKYATVPTDLQNMPKKGIGNIFDDALYGNEQYDVGEWRLAQDRRPPGSEECFIPTCAFPWSISDASTAGYLRDVYKTRWERGAARGPSRRRV